MKKLAFKILVIILALFIIIAGKKVTQNLLVENSSDYSDDIEESNISSIDILKDENYINGYFVIKRGDKYTPTLTFTPEDISIYQKRVSWSLSNTNIVSVDYLGQFIALYPGDVTVKATSTKDTSLSTEFKIKVIDQVEEVSINKDILNKTNVLKLGEVSKIDFYSKGYISLYDFTWSSSDENIATVENGIVRTHNVGATKITVKSLKDPSYTSSVDILVMGQYSVIPPTEVSVKYPIVVNGYSCDEEEFKNAIINPEAEVTIETKASSIGAEETYYEVENNDLVKIINTNGNKITLLCLNPGVVNLRAYSIYDKNVYTDISFNITPKDLNSSFLINTPKIEKFEIIGDVKNLYLEEGNIQKILMQSKYAILPASFIKLTSSNEDVVSIVDNYIFANSKGNATITINYIYDESYKETFNVIVSENNNYTRLSDITISNTLKNDKTFNLIDYDKNNVYLNDKISFDIDIYPKYITNDTSFLLLNSNDDVAKLTYTIKDKVITVNYEFVENGKTEFYLTCLDNPTCDIMLEFDVVNKNEVDFSYNKIAQLEKGQTANLNLKLKNNVKNVEVTYTSSDENVVLVGKNGELLAKNDGTSTITIYATDKITSKESSYEVTVIKEQNAYSTLEQFISVVKFNSEVINPNEKLFYIGDNFSLDISYKPLKHPFGDYYDIFIENEDILKYTKNKNSYVFESIKAGTTKLTIYPYANPALKIEYTITIANIMPEFVLLDFPYDKVLVGDKYQFGILIDWRATYKNVDIVIDNSDVVSIENDYFVINKEGDANILFNIDDNDNNTVSYSCNINIHAENHNMNVRIARYGYVNFIVRIVSQIVMCIIIGIVINILFKEIKMNLYIRNILSIFASVIIIVIVYAIRKNIPVLLYEEYDININLISVIISSAIMAIINIFNKNNMKEERYEKNN